MTSKHTITLHSGDLSAEAAAGLSAADGIAVDSETMGLNPHRDRLCVVQLSAGDGHAHLVQLQAGSYEAPRLKELLTNAGLQKIFHFARFDVAAFQAYLSVRTENIFCTKIASKLTRTYTDRHGLKDLCSEMLGVELDKQQQSSDWGAPELSDQQQRYAASDVLYLHRLRDLLTARLAREGRSAMAQAAFDFLPVRAELDLAGWADQDIFAHK